ncbi:hypothetical protein LPJ66_010829, partial [Kickxella alabastrina]
MIKKAQISRDNLVVENCAARDIDVGAIVGNDDDRALQGDVGAEAYVAGDREVVELKDLRR